MRILFVDESDLNISIFHSVVAKFNTDILFAASKAKTAIIYLLDEKIGPDYILIMGDLKEIKCKEFIEFIKKNERPCNSKIIVLGKYFSKAEYNKYKKIGATKCIATEINHEGITSLLKCLHDQ